MALCMLFYESLGTDLKKLPRTDKGNMTFLAIRSRCLKLIVADLSQGNADVLSDGEQIRPEPRVLHWRIGLVMKDISIGLHRPVT